MLFQSNFLAIIACFSYAASESAQLWINRQKQTALETLGGQTSLIILDIFLNSLPYAPARYIARQGLHFPFYEHLYDNFSDNSRYSGTANKIMSIAALGIAGTAAMELMRLPYPSILNYACYTSQIGCDIYQCLRKYRIHQQANHPQMPQQLQQMQQVLAPIDSHRSGRRRVPRQ